MWEAIRNLAISFWPYVLVAALIAFCFMVLLAVGCLEKQRIRDFEPAGAVALPPASPYFQAMNEAARALGFQLDGVFGQNRDSSTYRCCLALWLSADRRTLLCIGGGKLARMNYRRTFLISESARIKRW